MSEIKLLTDFVLSSANNGCGLALATVVDCEGSVYRRPGARMVVDATGAVRGSVSGGCLEADLRVRAPSVIESGRPQVIVYRGSGEPDSPWGFALGCNGTVTVLLQRLEADDIRGWEFMRREHAQRNPVAFGVWFERSGIAEDAPLGIALSAAGPACVSEGFERAGRRLQLMRKLQAVLKEEATSIRRPTDAGSYSALIEFLPPPERLLIIGGGADAIPIVSGARSVGWETIVVDYRQAYLRPESFPGAQLRLGSACDVLAGFVGDSRTAALVMNHHIDHDRAALRALEHVVLAYLGVLGPRVRTQTLLTDLDRADCRPWALRHDKFYAPVGLAIRAETAEEISVAVLAEIMAVFRGGIGKSLREIEGSIHATPATALASVSTNDEDKRSQPTVVH